MTDDIHICDPCGLEESIKPDKDWLPWKEGKKKKEPPHHDCIFWGRNIHCAGSGALGVVRNPTSAMLEIKAKSKEVQKTTTPENGLTRYNLKLSNALKAREALDKQINGFRTKISGLQTKIAKQKKPEVDKD